MTYPLSTARGIADELAEAMQPYCEKISVAGSVRRQKPYVKDIELVIIPKWRMVRTQIDLFNIKTEETNLLYEHLKDSDLVEWIKPGTKEIIPWHIKEDGKYWRGLIAGRIKLDLFLCSESNFGIIYAIRTGSRDFSVALMTHIRSCGYRVDKGHIWKEQTLIETPDERGVFEMFNLEYVEPQNRVDGRSLKVLKKDFARSF